MDDADPCEQHPRFARARDYLRVKAPAGLLPGRQHIDPLEIPDLLPYLTLVDVVRDGAAPRFRFRLIGTEVVQKTGRDLTGLWVDEAFDPEWSASVVEAYAGVVQTRRPHFWRSRLLVRGREHVTFDRVILPLARNGQDVDMLMGVHVFGGKPAS